MFKDYSRGMKMKLAIAVALSHQPKLLILDEATSGLDPIIRDEILEIFNEFTREEDHTVLLSSHIISDLEKISDYIAFLHQGKLLFCEEKENPVSVGAGFFMLWLWDVFLCWAAILAHWRGFGRGQGGGMRERGVVGATGTGL